MHTLDLVGKKQIAEDKSFRDSIATVDKKGKRIWLYPKNPKGKFTSWRTVLAWFFIGLMLTGPFMKIGGEPILLLNVLERKFIILGKIFWPQDFDIFLLVMLAFMIFIVLFTVVFGRVFCGWICPQTIFMESVFRKIEYWIEGDRQARIVLDRSPRSPSKVFKKVSKHSIFLLVSFVIANTFLSYIIGIDEVIQIVTDPVTNLGTLGSLFVFTLVFYGVFSRMREQVCTTVCPYGRLQGVLTDKNTLTVAYDYVRGETRGKFRKNESRSDVGKGDCIDCRQCVDVCPTGIDIRNGTQMECVNCTACMDACDAIMAKLDLKKGLIRMDSEAGIAEGKPFKITPRIIGYSFVLLILLGFIFSMLMFRSDVETTFLRTPGVLYQQLPDNKISNLYNIKMINKTNKEKNITIKLVSGDGEVKLVGKGKDIIIPPQGTGQTSGFIILNKGDITGVKTKLKLGVFEGDKQIETISTTFIGPMN